MEFPFLEENWSRVRDRIDAARQRGGVAHGVRAIAVTKGHPVSAIRAAARVGIGDIGENRVQEALEKRDVAGNEPVRWHLIGHLQTNKARMVPGTFGWVQSVDSLRLATALNREMKKRVGDGCLNVLLQVNVAGEEQKSGCTPDEAGELACAVGEMDRLHLAGLMTMAPLTDEERVVRNTFASARKLYDDLRGDHGLTELSMGMSGDFEIAVEEGATMVRLGTVLFGERPK